jgi:PhnB protein
MAKVHVYLNFNGNCEEAFQFYGTVFNTTNTGIYRYGAFPPEPNMPPLSEGDKNKVMHTAIHINEGTMLMGTDIIEGFGQKLTNGNSTYIMLDVTSSEEARKLFDALAKDARNLEMDLGETFFAELFSSFQDKYGICWMVHYEGNKKIERQEK